jgi:hypothetical protein
VKRWQLMVSAFLAAILLALIYGGFLLRRAISARDAPSSLEMLVARSFSSLAIPARAKKEKESWPYNSENIKEGREKFIARCAGCHNVDGSGETEIGRNQS